jgi:hypothetical protein
MELLETTFQMVGAGVIAIFLIYGLISAFKHLSSQSPQRRRSTAKTNFIQRNLRRFKMGNEGQLDDWAKRNGY